MTNKVEMYLKFQKDKDCQGKVNNKLLQAPFLSLKLTNKQSIE